MSRVSTRGVFVRERLIEAREASGLTQKDVARGLKRGESTIGNWERGTQTPEPASLAQLAEELNVYQSYLTRPMPDHGPCPVFFRSLAAASARARTREKARVRWLQHISLAMQNVLDLPPIDLPDFLEGRNYVDLKTEDLESIAISMRKHWDLGEGPVRTMVLVAENAGIVIGVDEAGSTAIDGQGTWSKADGRPYILLCTDKYTAYRRQMDVSHELAHLVLHKNVVSVDELERNFEKIERQAKYLAAALLLPHRSFAAEISSLSLDGFLSLKRRWMVSVGAMIMRAEQMEILTPEAAAYLWRYRATRGWHRKEPLDLPEETPVEQPCLLRRCIEMLVSQGGRSKRDLLEIDIGLGGAATEMLTCLPGGYFNAEPASVVRLAPKLRVVGGDRRAPDVSESGVVPFRKPS